MPKDNHPFSYSIICRALERMTPVSLTSSGNSRPLSPARPMPSLTMPLNPSWSAMLTVLNSRKLVLLQSRLDRHEVELAELYDQVDNQRILITQLIELGQHVSDRLGVSEQKVLRLMGLVKVIVLQMSLLKVRIRRDKALRESVWQLKLTGIWSIRRELFKWLALFLIAHGLLRITQAYSASRQVFRLTVPSSVSPTIKRRLQSIGSLIMLAAGTITLESALSNLTNSFPFRWFF